MAGILFLEKFEMASYFSSLKKSASKAKLVWTILLVQESNGLWTEPGGKKEPNETDKQTASREAQEEFCNFIRLGPKQLSSKAQVTLATGYKAFLVVGDCRLGFSLEHYKRNREEILKELKAIEEKVKQHDRSAATTASSKTFRILTQKRQTVSSWNETKNITRVALHVALLAVFFQARSPEEEKKKNSAVVLVRDIENNILLLHSRTVAVLQNCLRQRLLKLPFRSFSRFSPPQVWLSPNIPKVLFRVAKFKTLASKELEFLKNTMSYVQVKKTKVKRKKHPINL